MLIDSMLMLDFYSCEGLVTYSLLVLFFLLPNKPLCFIVLLFFFTLMSFHAIVISVYGLKLQEQDHINILFNDLMAQIYSHPI